MRNKIITYPGKYDFIHLKSLRINNKIPTFARIQINIQNLIEYSIQKTTKWEMFLLY